MKNLIFFTTIFLVSVSGYVNDWGLVQTTRDSIEIIDCLKTNNNLRVELNNYIDVGRLGQGIFKQLLQVFEQYVVHVEHVNRTLTNILNDLVSGNELNRNRAGQVRESIFRALLNCTDDPQENDIVNDLVNELSHHNVPNFHESSEFSDLLNLILVDPESLLEQTNGLATLLSFARNALRVFQSLVQLSPFGILRVLWQALAQSFFDFSAEVPFIRYTYSIDSSTVYTLDEPEMFNTRARDEYDIRNPPASQEDISRVLRFHRSNQVYRIGNVFNLPNNRRTITEADVYYEICENRFYRVIFFYLELVDRGYADLNGNVLTDRPIPENFLQLLRNDDYYCPYFETTRNRELDFARSNGLVATEGYLNSPRQYYHIFESKVIMLFLFRLQHLRTTPVVPLSTTISSIGASSTSRSEETNHKGNQASSSEKDSPKSQEESDDEDNENRYNYDLGPSCAKYLKKSQSFDEGLLEFELLRDIFLTMLESRIHTAEGLTYL